MEEACPSVLLTAHQIMFSDVPLSVTKFPLFQIALPDIRAEADRAPLLSPKIHEFL